MATGTDGLTDRQRRFVEEYLLDLNATQAAVRAGYSARTARQAGAENLSKPVIQAAVAEAQRARSERTQVTQDYVLARLKAEAEYQGGSQSARVAALALLGKHLGMFDGRGGRGGGDAPAWGEKEQAQRLAIFRERYARVHPEEATETDGGQP